MKNNPVISVGLPAYNGEKYLSDAIKSVLNQTYTNFELIISDDNSCDKTPSICLNFAKNDSRIRFFPQNKTTGTSKNYNFTLFKARAKYFIWICQDDFWDRTLLEKLYMLIRTRKDVVFATSNTTNIYKPKAAQCIEERYPLQDFTNVENKYDCLLKFIKSGNLTYLYALYKTRVFKLIEGYQKSSRPFFKSSDYLTIFRALTFGPMIFTNEYLFFKRDTGLYLKRYLDLDKLKIDRNYLKKTLRYLFFPLFFLYDTVLSVKYVLLSDFNGTQKLRLAIECVVYYFKRNFYFVYSLFLGLHHLLKGFGRRFTYGKL